MAFGEELFPDVLPRTSTGKVSKGHTNAAQGPSFDGGIVNAPTTGAK